MKILLAFFFLSLSPAFAVQIKVAEAPYNDLALTVQAIETAQKSILLNIYELSSPEITKALIDRVNEGLHVEILEEGQPVGGMSKASKKMLQQLVDAMARSKAKSADDHLYVMTSKAGGKRRYRFDHAKYMVVDNQNLLIGSENYSPTGNPKPGKIGNRGWEVFIHDSDLAARFANVFRGDVDVSSEDVIDATAQDMPGDDDENSDQGDDDDVSLDLERLKNIARKMPIIDADDVKPIFSPDTSESGLVGMIQHARKTLDIEQMTFQSEWSKDEDESPLFTAVVEAARRGVEVRVLMNDESVFDRPSRPAKRYNVATMKKLNGVAKKEHLKLAARIADLEEMRVGYIHNKGALIDGRETLVSSINWGQNSVQNNREAAVLIESQAIFSHYEELFDHDWKASAR